MSGETEAQVSGWTVDTLKQHFDKQFELRDREVRTALASLDHRLDGMNEFRASVDDITSQSMPRAEAEQRFSALEERMREMQTQVTAFISAATGRQTGLSDYIGWVVGIGGVLVAVIAILQG